MHKEDIWDKLKMAIIDGDEKVASDAAQEIVSAGINPIEAIQEGAVKGLDTVGERFQRLEIFLPELIRAGKAMKACMAVLTPHISSKQLNEISPGKVVIGTVAGDIHDIGKNIVATMLSSAGFDIYDLGIDVSVKQFIEKAEEVKAKVIALSALMATSAYHQQEVIRLLEDLGLRKKYYVVIGGGPVTPEWATQIGADGYGRTAVDAKELVRRLVTGGVPPPLPQPILIG
jgi:corrinoid protein of di/trimethylamine methyltransferase